MCVQIAAQEQQLKEKHAGGPNRWRAAKPRQDVFAQYQLNLEKKKCSAKDCEAVAEACAGRRQRNRPSSGCGVLLFQNQSFRHEDPFSILGTASPMPSGATYSNAPSLLLTASRFIRRVFLRSGGTNGRSSSVDPRLGRERRLRVRAQPTGKLFR